MRSLPLALVLCCCGWAAVGTAQTVTLDESGDEILVYPDGSWRYVDSLERGTMLFDPQLDEGGAARTDPFADELAPWEAGGDTARAMASAPHVPAAPVAPPVVNQDPGDIDWPAEERARVVIRADVAADLAEADVLQKDLGRLRGAVAEQTRKLERVSAADRDRSDDAIANAKRKRDAAEDDLAAAEQRIGDLRRGASLKEQTYQMTIAERQAHLASTGVAKGTAPATPTEPTVDKAPTAVAETVANAEERSTHEAPRPASPDNLADEPRPAVVDGEPGVKDREPSPPGAEPAPDQLDLPGAPAERGRRAAPPRERSAVAYAAYDRARDPRYNPPARACGIVSEGVDEFTRQRKRALAEVTLFTHTTPDLKPYLGDQPLITGLARVVELGDDLTLEMTYQIRSQYANREFGVLARGAGLTLKLVGGGEVNLRNLELDRGSYDAVDKVYTFHGRYPLPSVGAKSLRRAPVDRVRVMWGSGFEDYTVYDVALLMHLLGDCL